MARSACTTPEAERVRRRGGQTQTTQVLSKSSSRSCGPGVQYTIDRVDFEPTLHRLDPTRTHPEARKLKRTRRPSNARTARNRRWPRDGCGMWARRMHTVLGGETIQVHSHCLACFAKGSVESTHKVPTSHYHTKHRPDGRWRCGRVARWTNTPPARIIKDPDLPPVPATLHRSAPCR